MHNHSIPGSWRSAVVCTIRILATGGAGHGRPNVVICIRAENITFGCLADEGGETSLTNEQSH